MTVPGVPDLYQGSDLWDLSLVDPDNRRPVDWQRRFQGPLAEPLDTLAAAWRDGGIKQALIARVLGLRRQLPDLFADGDYRPVKVEGRFADAVLAFVRSHAEAWMLVVCPRLPLCLPLVDGGVTLTPGDWQDTAILLDDAPRQPLIAPLLGQPAKLVAGRVSLGSLCAPLPLAVLCTAGAA
jgi:maltooligosyltrehalose synthase